MIKATGRDLSSKTVKCFCELSPAELALRTPSYVAWTENERLLGDAAKNQAATLWNSLVPRFV